MAQQKQKETAAKSITIKQSVKQPKLSKQKRDIEIDLDRLESTLSELKMLYEQYFIDVLPQPPTKLQKEVKITIRQLLKAPFKTSQSKFRLRMLVQRYQTYNTYWERVNKQREEGTYDKDVFKAEIKQRMLEESARESSSQGAAERGLKQLFSSYQQALQKTGARTENINFDSFKVSLMKKAKQLKEKHGVNKLHYKIMVKEGKVIVKATPK